MSSSARFLSDSLYAVGAVCVLSAIVEGAAISLLHPAFGSFWDSRDGFFTLLDLAAFPVFQLAGISGFWANVTAFGAIVLSAPGAFYMFDLFMWMQFGAADGIWFPLLSLALLSVNAILITRRRMQR